MKAIHAIMTMPLRHLAASVICAMAAGSSWAADPCERLIVSNDAMQFNTSLIEVPASCKKFNVELRHVGKLPKSAMGHNWVLARSADVQAVATDGIAAGLAANYVKPGDSRVIAQTKILGGGESDTVSFDVGRLKAGETYTFFCSFPGHASIMKGTLALK